MNSIKISIITINLNNLEGLKKTSKSIPINPNIEWVVIDGASNDGSVDFLNQVPRKPDKIISEKDSGIYDAMNKGLHLANGDYVNFMNSGDCFKNNFFENTMNNFNNDCDIVYGNTELSDGGIIYHPNKLDFFYVLNKMINHQSLFIKRQLLLKYPFNVDYKIVADWVQLFHILKFENPSIQYLNEIFCIYDVTGVSSNNDAKRKSEKLFFLKSIYGDWELNDLIKYSKIKIREWNPIVERAVNSKRIDSLMKFFNKIMLWTRI